MPIVRRRHVLSLAALILLGSPACENSPRPTAPSPVDPIVGAYTLTLTAGSECAVIPAAARSRIYTARFESNGRQRYLVTLSDATFVTDVQLSASSFWTPCGGPRHGSGLGCNQFTAAQDGEEIEFQLVPNSQRQDHEFAGNGGTIVEEIAPGTALVVHGTGRGRLDAQTIQATLNGGLWYYPSWPAWGDSVSCNGDLRLTLNRK